MVAGVEGRGEDAGVDFNEPIADVEPVVRGVGTREDVANPVGVVGVVAPPQGLAFAFAIAAQPPVKGFEALPPFVPIVSPEVVVVVEEVDPEAAIIADEAGEGLVKFVVNKLGFLPPPSIPPPSPPTERCLCLATSSLSTRLPMVG